jgi:hypothetical protein
MRLIHMGLPPSQSVMKSEGLQCMSGECGRVHRQKVECLGCWWLGTSMRTCAAPLELFMVSSVLGAGQWPRRQYRPTIHACRMKEDRREGSRFTSCVIQSRTDRFTSLYTISYKSLNPQTLRTPSFGPPQARQRARRPIRAELPIIPLTQWHTLMILVISCKKSARKCP